MATLERTYSVFETSHIRPHYFP